MGKLLQIWFITAFYGLLKLVHTIFANAIENVFLATTNKNRFFKSFEDAITRKHLSKLLNPESTVYTVDYEENHEIPEMVEVNFERATLVD